jgi:hypothetical protein
VLTFCTWLWGDKFSEDDLDKLAAGLRRRVNQPHRILCMTDRLLGRRPISGVSYKQILDYELLAVKGCFVRLRIFDPYWQFLREIRKGEKIVVIDLDTVITGNLDPLFDRHEPFVIMQGANATNPCPFNGALQMLRAGYRPDVWADFSLGAAAKTPHHEFPDDQGWLHHKIPDAAGWKVGPEHGVYVYNKPGWPGGDALPEGARLVTFINKHPSQFSHLDWVKDNFK